MRFRDVGLSSKCAQAYSLKDMADDVIGLLDHLDIARAHVFGISLGGIVAQLIGVHHGERVGCLFSVMSGSGKRRWQSRRAADHHQSTDAGQPWCG